MHTHPLPMRRWLYVMPLIFISYSLAFLDKANYSFAAAGGINRDLGITQGLSSLIGSLFFLGYFFFQIPGGILAEKTSVRKLLACSLVIWGICATATGLVHSIPLLIVIRFILGIVEAVVMPTVLILTARWFTKKERSKANTIFLLGNPVTILWMSILSGYLIDNFGWRHMFVVQGIPAIVWAAVWYLLIRDKPEEAGWLTAREKTALSDALKAEQTEKPQLLNYGQVFRSPNVLKLSGWLFFQSIGFYGFLMWLPSILHSSSITMSRTGLLTSLPYGLAVVFMLLAGWLSDRLQKRIPFIVYPILVAGCCFLALALLGINHFWVAYGLLTLAGVCMYIPFGSFFASIPDVLPSSMVGGATGMVNSIGSLGAFLGAYAVGFLNGLMQTTQASYYLMAVCLGLSALFGLWIKIPKTVNNDLPKEGMSLNFH
ncbi:MULTISPECIES: MFS transporter [Sodalis]|jgi:sugar phosphate permease|uniref:Sugar phosphate permease n=1 Tax=Sodalis ligni TaxID=2697027 RepID=A0A4R1NDV4_9GAMM|nr:MFS transporter [Sodalis ligni]TCL05009.1 sugar phosphate permease [Sodalis ligni]